LFFAAPNTLHVVHHLDYVVPVTGQGTFGHDKYSRGMDALRESGVPMTAHVLDGNRTSFPSQPTHDCGPLLIGGRNGANRFCRVGTFLLAQANDDIWSDWPADDSPV